MSCKNTPGEPGEQQLQYEVGHDDGQRELDSLKKVQSFVNLKKLIK
jgi:hypothetical protein